MVSVFIIDDEAPARDELKYLLEEIPEVEVIGTARNGLEALEQIPEKKPQVVFLDIQMPGMSGIHVARELIRRIGFVDLPVIVFATAFDQHALEAFEVHAFDYVLKPFSSERLAVTMERIKHRLKNPTVSGNETKKIDRILSLLEKPVKKTKIPVEEDERIILLDPDDIVYAGIKGRHVMLKTNNREYITNYSLTELEERLGLLQTHKSYLVNRNMVREVIPWFNGTYNLVMADQEKSEVPVSRTYVRSVRITLQI